MGSWYCDGIIVGCIFDGGCDYVGLLLISCGWLDCGLGFFEGLLEWMFFGECLVVSGCFGGCSDVVVEWMWWFLCGCVKYGWFV